MPEQYEYSRLSEIVGGPRADPRKLEKIIVRELKEYGAYVWYRARTGSIYVKFSHWGLGSVRIGDHPGYEKYRYRWRIRIDVRPDFRESIAGRDSRKRVVDYSEYGAGMLDKFFEDFRLAAKDRGISPGDKETWDEHIGRDRP